MNVQNWIRFGYVTYIGIALLSFVRRVSRLGSLVFPYRDYSISITLHTISFSTPNSGLYSEINDTKQFKLIVDAPFVYTVASNATTKANIRYTMPDGYIAVGLVKVSSLHNSVLVCKKVIIPTCIIAQRSWVQIK